MENSPYTDVTLEIFETLWQQEYRNVGVVLQAYLPRTEGDVRRMNELGARVRLVKGAYKEPASVAYQQKADVEAAFMKLTRLLLDHGNYPAIATHDSALIAQTRAYALEHGIASDRFEFQMLYGIRRDLQRSLLGERLPDARVRPLREAVVSLLHAASWGKTRKRCLRGEVTPGGEKTRPFLTPCRPLGGGYYPLEFVLQTPSPPEISQTATFPRLSSRYPQRTVELWIPVTS